MTMMIAHRLLRALLVVTLAVSLLTACQRREDPPPVVAPSPPVAQTSPEPSPVVPPVGESAPTVKPRPTVAAKGVHVQAGAPLLVEEQAHALSLWRQFSDQAPVLLLFSGKVLRPLPDVLQGEVDRLLQLGDERELARRVAQPVPDQLLAADLGVAAAMRQGYFSRVIWVVPLEEGAELLSLEDFKGGLRQRAPGWGEGVDSFAATADGTYSGVLGGVPVEVVGIDRLPVINEPVLVHLDAGFFSVIYRNEVKTPLYPLIAGHLGKLSAKDYRVLGVSVSHDNQSFEVPLSLRGLGRDLAGMIASPERLRQPTPAMTLRAEIRYLDSFFQPDTIEQKARELIKRDPADADNHYVLYRALRQARQLDQALVVLEQAIARDPLYANEYIELVGHAVEKQQYPAALAMIDSAIRALPDNPLIKFRKAQLLVDMGNNRQAATLLKELEELPWSSFFYPNIRKDIDKLLLTANQQQ